MDANEVTKAVAAGISEAAPALVDEVVRILVDRETKKRAQALTTAFDELRKLKSEANRADKPDQVTFNADGSKATETFSKTALEARQKSGKAVEKMTNVINKALNGDFDDLNNLVNGKGGDANG